MTASRGWRAAVIGTLLAACGPDDARHPDHCPTRPVATFRLVVAAPPAATLPADLVLTVRYGGGEEVFRLVDPPAASAVFCRSASRDGGAAGIEQPDGGVAEAGVADGGAPPTDVEAISCTLWTNGAATVHVTGTGLIPMDEPLAATKDPECGDLVTTDVRLDLVAETDVAR